jgi:hypothetical protein
MHPIEPARAPLAVPAQSLQPESWFHQYINAYPRMDEQQYGPREPDELACDGDTSGAVQNPPRRAQS